MTDEDPPFDEPIEIPITDVLDLHHFQPKEIRGVVEEYLNECQTIGLLTVRLIHGKGKGVQRSIVQSLLDVHPAVISYADAPLEAGSWGATIVRLKEKL